MPQISLVGTRIRARRVVLGLRQAEVARRAGVSASYLNLIEHNKRAIAGKVLLDIARVLELDVAGLLEGADADLVRRIQSTVSGEMTVERTQAEDLVTRFPGWSGLLAQLGDRVQQLEATVAGLSDRLTHDPFLSESLHEMLSSVTAIQATSGILSQNAAMEPLQQRRFHTNIHDESLRLSDLSQALARYFDSPAHDARALSTPQDELDAFLVGHHHHFAALEGGTARPEALNAEVAGLGSQAARELARGFLRQYRDDAKAMPLDTFLRVAKACGYKTAPLARHFAVALSAVYRRLAFLPADQGRAAVGLIQIDATGATLVRKPLPGFALPRYGAACALWPVYHALARPLMPLRAVLEMPDDMRFLAQAHCHYLGEPDFAVPPVVRSTMMVRALPALSRDDATPHGLPVLRVGTSCRICPRPACGARRQASIHDIPV